MYPIVSTPWPSVLVAVGGTMAVMDERARLRVEDIDLPGLIVARNDDHPAGDWWFDPRSGESLYYGVDDDEDLPALIDGVHVLVPTAVQPRTDVDDFFAVADELGVDDATVMDLYHRYRGKGGLRRFRDRVSASPAAEAWAAFTLRREAIRALAWLVERDVIDQAEVDRWAAGMGDGVTGYRDD